MKVQIRSLRATCVVFVFTLGAVLAIAQPDPLPSWNDTGPKKAIIAFVQRIKTDGGPDFVPIEARIATFDNDGTLWVEQPIYTQFAFAIDRVKGLAPQHPEWKDRTAFQGSVRERSANSLGEW